MALKTHNAFGYNKNIVGNPSLLPICNVLDLIKPRHLAPSLLKVNSVVTTWVCIQTVLCKATVSRS